MKLMVLGTAGYHPSEERHTACLMLPEQGIVLDAGTGMFRTRDLIVAPTLDIYLTHAHLDHVVGLTYLLDVLFDKQVDRTTVHGEAEKLAAVRDCLFSEFLFPVDPPFAMNPLTIGETQPLTGGGTITSFPLKHPGNSIGYRLDWPDHSMAYVTDTTAESDSQYIEQIKGVDLLVHECNFPDRLRAYAVKTGHSHTTPVMQVAAKAQVGKLVLVHMNPLESDKDPIGLDEGRKIFANSEIAVDGMSIEF